MLHFNQKLFDIIQLFLKTTFLKNKLGGSVQKKFNDKDLQYFAKGAELLSTLFTEDRASLEKSYYNNPIYRSGYLLYFLPINFVKALYVLSQIPEMFWPKTMDVADLGSGPGSASLALLDLLTHKKSVQLSKLDLYDHSAKALQDAHFLITQTFNKTTTTHTIDLNKHALRGSYDFILLSHVLNEWQDRSSKINNVLKLAHNHLKPEGLLILIEPALKRPSRDLMAVRDAAINEAGLQVLSPCTHQQQCPMLIGAKGDWCHFYIDWQQDDVLKKLDKIVGNDNHHLKCSYVILYKGTKQVVKNPAIGRIVSNRMQTKGKMEVVVCHEHGRTRLTRLDKERSSCNQSLDHIKRGDSLDLEPFSFDRYDPNRNLRVGRETRVKIK